MDIKLSDYDFELPQELIAQTPAPERDRSRLMVVNRQTGTLTHDVFANICKYLPDRPLMVFNDTRVLPVKLTGFKKPSGKPLEVLLVRERESTVWEALFKGLGSMKPGTELILGEGAITATLKGRENGRGILKLSYQGELLPILDRAARMPLPPYIRREFDADTDLLAMDRSRYQTVYADKEGAIAAPTAGLHFTPELLKEIASGKADIAYLTLHVGAGTFSPIRAQNVLDHKMEKERFILAAKTWNLVVKAKMKGQKVLAVGTTATRALESLTFDSPIQEEVSGETDRFIYPGVEFKTVGHLLTNFHLPQSTLFLLVCAFAGTDLMRKAYQEAIREKYRFFSYGDAMLIL